MVEMRGNLDSRPNFDYIAFMLSIPQQVNKTVAAIDPAAKVILFGSSDLLYDIELETDQVITSVIEGMKLWEAYEETAFFKNVKREGVEVKLPGEA
jgi:hypothetical protein